MSHALTLPILASLTSDSDRVPFHADPILAAIERHSEAWAAFQIAPTGKASADADADAETFDALHALLATPCATRAGMLCLIRHLRWFIENEAPNAEAYENVGGPNAWTIAQAREADLSRCHGVERIERLPLALPSGRLIGPVIDHRPEPVPFAQSYPAALPPPRAVRPRPIPGRRDAGRPRPHRWRLRLRRLRLALLNPAPRRGTPRCMSLHPVIQGGRSLPTLKLRNPLRCDPNRPTLKQRAAALKATAARLIHKPKNSPNADADLCALARPWEAARRLYDRRCEEHKAVDRAAMATASHPGPASKGAGSEWHTDEALDVIAATMGVRVRRLSPLLVLVGLPF